ncbi:hypothetical protein ACQUQU_06895 [Thalassolituus sp. LLYu03]|uniref:hypothetical protein n=1 Tax=Thalassolituus sp. LLYu03 TaxID=3421656 RepID=UPI003D2E54CB
MGKVLALTLTLPVVAVAAAGAYMTHTNVVAYEQAAQKALQDSNAELLTQGIKVNYELVSSNWFGASREEAYTVRMLEQGADILTVRQHVTIEPFRAYGSFGIDPDAGMAAMFLKQVPQLTDQQRGEWQLDGRTGQITTHYQTGGFRLPVPNGELSVSPLIMDSVSWLEEPRRSKTTIELRRVAAKSPDLGKEGELNNLSMEFRGHMQGNKPFIDRASYSIGELVFTDGDDKTRIAGFSTTQAALLERGIFSMLVSTELKDLKVSAATNDLSVDPSTVRIFVDGLNWKALQATSDVLAETDSDAVSPYVILDALAGIGAEGASVTLEELQSSFVFNDRSPDGIGAAGDFTAKGSVTLQPGDAGTLAQEWPLRTQADLSLNLSRSLMQSPLSELMVGLIDEGYLREEGDRLLCDLRYAAGVITANNLPVDTMAFSD